MADTQILKDETFFTPKRISRMSILIALSGVGAFVKIPTPTGDMGLDSAPGYFAGMVEEWDWKEAQIIGIFARLLAAWVVGFPLGLPVQFLWGTFLGSSMGIVVRAAKKKFGYIASIVAAGLYNGLYFQLIVVTLSFLVTGGGTPKAAFAAGAAGAIGTTVASVMAASIGALSHKALSKTTIINER